MTNPAPSLSLGVTVRHTCIELEMISHSPKKCRFFNNNNYQMREMFDLGNPALDLDSVLFLDSGSRVLGRVFDVIGPVQRPYYCVR